MLEQISRLQKANDRMHIENKELEDELNQANKKLRMATGRGPLDRAKSIPRTGVVNSLMGTFSPGKSAAEDQADKLAKKLEQVQKESKESNTKFRTLISEKQSELESASQEIERLTKELSQIREHKRSAQ